jgi:hypothetical protein
LDAETPLERQLTAKEFASLMDIVIDGGLVEFDPDDLEKRFKSSAPPSADIIDASTLLVSISLASYESEKRSRVEPFTHYVAIYAPEHQIARYRAAGRAGAIVARQPASFVEAEALLRLFMHVEQRFFRE